MGKGHCCGRKWTDVGLFTTTVPDLVAADGFNTQLFALQEAL
jgi:hypothetical protein